MRVPASDPAELAAYAGGGSANGSVDSEQSYVDLGWVDDAAGVTDADQFGPVGSDDQIELDAA